MKSIILTLALVLGVLGQAMAETRYVSDRLEIQMRAGKGTQFRILRSLPSGTPLEVLEVDKENQYSRVRAPDGVEGWVLNHLLMSGPSARDRLAKAEKKLAQLELENRKLKAALADLRKAKGSTDKERSSLQKEANRVSQELERIRRTASSALAIDAENKELKSRIANYERQSQSLLQENQSLKDRTARDWFMVGAGVILLGMIIGLIIPRIRWRKKSSWDSL
ncbi:SH3 domain protein [Thiogranum longum]|uniref:SH3 domain protein n=1 Tax=Thiogranum longum TaxID=1537524 RepID=A0A4R1HPR1_9GAMM|nr:TIGR04211 family SH3 domain-containing protein [Thiogranum longum]TCK19282.1 SH3 domain protein [Thiogranum longum]